MTRLRIILFMSGLFFALQACRKTEYANSQQMIAELCEQYDVTGLAMQYVSPDTQITVFYGQNAKGEPIDEHTIFEGASLSKTVFSTVMIRNFFSRFPEDQMLIDLGIERDSVQEFFDGVQTGSQLDELMGIKPIDLLNHSSGINQILGGEETSPNPNFEYSEQGYLFAQFVYTQLLQHDFSKNIHPKTDTDFDMIWIPDMIQNYTDGYLEKEKTDREIRQYKVPKSNGTLLCSVTGLSSFVQANMTDTLISFVTKRKISVDDDYPNLFWGNGMGIEINEGDTILWQWGNNYCYNSVILYNINTREQFAMLSNSLSSRKIFNEIASELMGKESFSCFEYVW